MHDPLLLLLLFLPTRDPFHQDRYVRELCADHGIHYTAYSTLGTQWQIRNRDNTNPVLESPLIMDLADHHKVSPALVTLSWALQEDVCVIPRSSNKEHIDEIAQLFHGRDWLRAYLTQVRGCIYIHS